MSNFPWTFKPGGDNEIEDSTGRCIISDMMYYPYVDLSDAEWHLIAAAPDQHAVLLAAPIVSKFCMKDGFDETGFFDAYEEWSKLKRAVISRAQGNAP